MKLKIKRWFNILGEIEPSGREKLHVGAEWPGRVGPKLEEGAQVEEIWLLNGKHPGLPKHYQRVQFALAQVKYGLVGMVGMKTKLFLVEVATMKAKPKEVRACSSANRVG